MSQGPSCRPEKLAGIILQMDSHMHLSKYYQDMVTETTFYGLVVHQTSKVPGCFQP